MSDVICKTCRDTGWVLHLVPRPGGPPGNISLGCKDCPPGRANQEACDREMQKALEEAERKWNTPEMKNAWDRAMQELQAERELKAKQFLKEKEQAQS